MREPCYDCPQLELRMLWEECGKPLDLLILFDWLGLVTDEAEMEAVQPDLFLWTLTPCRPLTTS